MTTMTRPTAPVDPIGADLTRTLRALKLGGMTDTLPERLHLARQQQLGHAAFLELVLSDEVTRREGRSAALRAAKAGLDPTMRLDTFDDQPDLTYDRHLWSDLTTLRFAEAGTGVLILGPVGVGKTRVPQLVGIRAGLSEHRCLSTRFGGSGTAENGGHTNCRVGLVSTARDAVEWWACTCGPRNGGTRTAASSGTCRWRTTGRSTASPTPKSC